MKKHMLTWLWLGMLPAFNLWAAVGDVRLDPATPTVALNTAFGLKLLVDSGTKKVGTYQVKLAYDSTKLQVNATTPVTEGTNTLGAPTVNATVAGTLRVNGFHAQGVGPGTALHIFTVNFKCLGVTGTYPVALTVDVLTTEGGAAIGAATPRAGIGSTVKCGSAPDFVITSIVVPSPGTGAPVISGTFSATIVVKNQGAASSTGGTLSVWNHNAVAPTVCSPTGFSKQATVGILAANASTTITVSGIPAGTIAGMRMLRAIVDSACVTSESNETNNQKTLVYSVVKAAPAADVAITAMSLSSAALAINGTFNATVTVKNNSTTTSSMAGILRVWNHFADAIHCGATGASKEVSVPALAPSATQVFSVTGIPAGAVVGMRRVRAYVDSTCTTAETNELNNQSFAAYAVNAAAPTADFSIPTITLSTANPVAGATFSATITVKNVSTTTAGDGKNLEVWNHNPGVAQYCGAIGTNRIAVGSVAANATVSKTITGLVAATGASGTRTLRAYVDSACGTNEVNEANNQAIKAY